jgi:hypothetical protein
VKYLIVIYSWWSESEYVHGYCDSKEEAEKYITDNQDEIGDEEDFEIKEVEKL